MKKTALSTKSFKTLFFFWNRDPRDNFDLPHLSFKLTFANIGASLSAIARGQLQVQFENDGFGTTPRCHP